MGINFEITGKFNRRTQCGNLSNTNNCKKKKIVCNVV